MPASHTPVEPAAPRSLASAGLPPRVRKALEAALTLVTDDIEPHLGAMLNEFEEELFRLADQARNPGVESGYMQTLRTFRLNRADLIPRFILELEAGVAALRTPPAPSPAQGASGGPAAQPGFGRLSLVDEAVMDEGTVLREVASRQEARANLALHLLGQRFGVLAGAPAFDSERMPLGPQALCRAMRGAAQALDIEHDSRLLLYRIFDRHVMAGYWRVLDRLDELLDRQGILSGLTYVPVRIRPSAQPRDQAEAGPGADDAASPHGRPAPGAASGRGRAVYRAADPQRPHTGWMGEPIEELDEDERVASEQLQHLLNSRRELLGKLRPGRKPRAGTVIGTDDVFAALGHLQAQPLSVSGAPQTLADVKQTLLAQARQRRGVHAELSPRDNDTFELLGMLFGNLDEEIRAEAPAAALVKRLQVPLLRVALNDSAFFVRSRHPARQLLNTVAESAAKWLDEADFDPQFLVPLQNAVNHVVEKYDGDVEVFNACNEQLQTHLQAQVRKAELLEKRHTEAARGKEKLEVAKLRAGQVMADLIGDQRLPRFTRALLNQAWADVLTLTLLRQGEDSEGWTRQLEATRKIVDACSRDDAPRDPELTGHIEAALAQVGYHGEEAAVIAQRLTSSRADEDDDDPASRTELAMKLKARTRLGEDAERKKPQLPPRTPEEQARYEQLKVLPFGTWLEFVTNQQGDVVRRRLSWFSPITDRALFVNQRGQRVGEQSLDSVARMLASGQARIVTAGHARLVDRAWQAAMHALRSFAGLGDKDAEGEGVPA
ncbi:DUF1631 domain-containing protein [Luteimonas sp. M1R5S18]|uniref:DUF1631 domain-containing protein n=1 Tax=Luteimonas rhizosphaericola TaxID=3042024 RepID=A0ABT6JKA1_9GAMM|nr:DUF1631 domain-containing protein [Luteimonas rhizosphaericola]MDH5830451.1 DUF1631 domain-containing protein [Luteimonas rhizosphaericola]